MIGNSSSAKLLIGISRTLQKWMKKILNINFTRNLVCFCEYIYNLHFLTFYDSNLEITLQQTAPKTPAESPNEFFKMGVSIGLKRLFHRQILFPQRITKSMFDTPPPRTMTSGSKISITLARPAPKFSNNSVSIDLTSI